MQINSAAFYNLQSNGLNYEFSLNMQLGYFLIGFKEERF